MPDRPTDSVPSAEIEITPAMIEAGQSCLDSLLDGTIEGSQGLHCIPSGWAERVYREMARVAPVPRLLRSL